jgi:DNA-binding CsgD family transcriptional regulator
MVTRTVEAPPGLTRREREVLLALCRPVLSGDLFTEPASVREIADQLVVTEAAVKHHLRHLYDKFGFEGASGRRRVHLANEAVRRGAVRISDLHRGRSWSGS